MAYIGQSSQHLVVASTKNVRRNRGSRTIRDGDVRPTGTAILA
jgi:hypothetical protein